MIGERRVHEEHLSGQHEARRSIADAMTMPDPPTDETEIQDAQTVARAIQALCRLDLAECERLLLPVIANTPANYVHEFQQDGTRYAKFWDREEFMAHSTMGARGETARLVWLPNAYPRAHYYMAYICVERQQPHEALRWLEAALALEPAQPRLQLEKALVLAGLRQHDVALRMYQGLIDAVPALPPSLRAVALRGRGLQLIELGYLDEAEQSFRESLVIDPDSPVAHKELEYIHHLRSGGEAAPIETASSPGGPSRRCSSCGEVLTGDEDTTPVVAELLCRRCASAERPASGSPLPTPLECGCVANEVRCDGFAVRVVTDACAAHVADKDVIQQLMPADPEPPALVHAALHAMYFAKT
ncbi:MAG TPA: hypothetical protein VIA61_02035, partial [Methylomirabilota bacterium]